MRSGQRAGRAHDLVTGDAAGRILCTVQFAMGHTGRSRNVVRRCAATLGALGCDVRTGALLYDAGKLGAAVNAVPVAPVRHRRNPGP